MLGFLVLPVVILLGQVPRGEQVPLEKLAIVLKNLQTVAIDRAALNRDLTDAMILLAQTDRPTRPTIQRFAQEFTDSLAGRSLTDLQLTTLRDCIAAMVVGSTSNLRSAASLREILNAVRVDPARSSAIVKDFIAVGETIQGPDDLRLNKFTLK